MKPYPIPALAFGIDLLLDVAPKPALVVLLRRRSRKNDGRISDHDDSTPTNGPASTAMRPQTTTRSKASKRKLQLLCTQPLQQSDTCRLHNIILSCRTRMPPLDQPPTLPISSSSSSLSSSGGSTVSSVSFGKVTVREYSRCAGDHPETKDGPPISLDWGYSELLPQYLSEYEQTRRQCNSTASMSSWARQKQRKGCVKRLSALSRREILMHEFGYTIAEVLEAEKNAQIAKRDREQTLRQTRLARKLESMANKSSSSLSKQPLPSNDKGSSRAGLMLRSFTESWGYMIPLGLPTT